MRKECHWCKGLIQALILVSSQSREKKVRRPPSIIAWEGKSSRQIARKKSDKLCLEGGSRSTKICWTSDFRLSQSLKKRSHRIPPQSLKVWGQVKNNPSVNLFSFPSPYDIGCGACKICRESPKNFLLTGAVAIRPFVLHFPLPEATISLPSGKGGGEVVDV